MIGANHDAQLKRRWRFGFSNAVLINKILCDFISLTILFFFIKFFLSYYTDIEQFFEFLDIFNRI